MVRVKRGVQKLKTRRNLLKKVKGYRFGRSKKEAQAREAYYHAGNDAFAHRKTKKRDYRRLFQIRINAAVRPLGLSYSKFVDALKKKDIQLNRKVLAELAKDRPDVFERVVEQVK
jgi:large subunit ribosomal protein L20